MERTNNIWIKLYRSGWHFACDASAKNPHLKTHKKTSETQQQYTFQKSWPQDNPHTLLWTVSCRNSFFPYHRTEVWLHSWMASLFEGDTINVYNPTPSQACSFVHQSMHASLYALFRRALTSLLNDSAIWIWMHLIFELWPLGKYRIKKKNLIKYLIIKNLFSVLMLNVGGQELLYNESLNHTKLH